MPAIDALQKLQQDLIRKSTNGSVFVAPVSAGAIDTTTLFNATTGDLSPTGLPTGYSDLGYLSTAGAAFGRSVSESNVTSWQSVTPTRSDTTADTTTLAVVAQETKAATIGLYIGVDLAVLKASAAANGVVRVNRPATPTTTAWRLLSIAVDEDTDGEIVLARFLPNAKPTGFGNQAYAPGDTPVSWEVTFTGFVDNTVGTAESYIFGGAGWLAKLAKMGFNKPVTVSTTSSSPNITATTGTFNHNDVGQHITGTGIPANTTILSVTDSTHAVLSAPASATGASVSAVLGG